MKQFELVLQPEEAAGSEDYKAWVAAQHQVPLADIKLVRLRKRAVDARGRQVRIRLWVDVFFNDEEIPADADPIIYKDVHNARPVIIVGCGPAGMFAALKLLEYGLKPVIIERGKDVKSRRRDLAVLNKQGIVNPDSNYCFGEGGAGTYSDGKLYTRSTKRGDVQQILEAFIAHGADAYIRIDTHPHIGTNKLPGVVSAMSDTIRNHGGEIHFNTSLHELVITNGKLKGVYIKQVHDDTAPVFLAGDALILATGHSAKNIFEMLHRQKINIESKPFAMGVRIEHPQQIIDAQQYHCTERGPYLPPASYTLTYTGAKKSMYSFCMCPGGIIAPAATDKNEIVVNGWSPSKRNNPFANSGLVVNIDVEDMIKAGYDGPLAGLQYQQQTEHQTWLAGGSGMKAPAQRMIDFVENRFSTSLPACSYIPGVTPALMRDVLPQIISDTLKEGLKDLKGRMKWYYTNEAILVAVESRTSSPVRIPRDKETLMHGDVEGLFPCGEGAGYAGGIVSAAIDGQRCAEQCMLYFQREVSV